MQFRFFGGTPAASSLAACSALPRQEDLSLTDLVRHRGVLSISRLILSQQCSLTR